MSLNENEKNINYDLVENFEKSLFEPIVDVGSDMVELGIDALLKDGLLKDIPIAGSIIGLIKFGSGIRERNFLKQTLCFINEYNNGNIKQEKLEHYRNEINNNEKKREDEIGRIIILLDRYIDAQQSQILAKLYVAYINGKINWERFLELSEANNRIFISDIKLLLRAYKENGLYFENEEFYEIERLISIGLFQRNPNLNRLEWQESVSPASRDKDILITSFGKLFASLLVISK